MPERIIRITPYGRMANQMLQLMMAERLRLSITDARVVGYDLPQWNLVSPAPPEQNALAVTMRSAVVPIEQIIEFANSVDYIDIRILSVNLRYAYYRSMLDHYRSLFRDPRQDDQGAGADQLVIAVRLGDILNGSHSYYFPLPLSWYEELIGRTGLSPIFVGEIGTDYYSEALKRRFPKARYVSHADPMADFSFLRNSVNIVVGVGTFSWLASWLSETAKTIYLPVAGLLNQKALPGIDLLPLDDERYRFFESAMEKWAATPAQIDFILNHQHDFREMGRDQLRALFPHVGTLGLALRPKPLVS